MNSKGAILVSYGVINPERFKVPSADHLRLISQSDISTTHIVATWQAWSPVVSNSDKPKLVDACFDCADALAEVSGDIQRRSIAAQFSTHRAVRSAAYSSAHSRFVAMHRKQRKPINRAKRGNQFFAKKDKAADKLNQLTKELKIAQLFLNRSKNKKVVGKWKKKISCIKSNIKLTKKRFDKWQKASGF
jgi:hypothetical protein